MRRTDDPRKELVGCHLTARTRAEVARAAQEDGVTVSTKASMILEQWAAPRLAQTEGAPQ